jgi:hypothetical protein
MTIARRIAKADLSYRDSLLLTDSDSDDGSNSDSSSDSNSNDDDHSYRRKKRKQKEKRKNRESKQRERKGVSNTQIQEPKCVVTSPPNEEIFERILAEKDKKIAKEIAGLKTNKDSVETPHQYTGPFGWSPQEANLIEAGR